MSKHHQLNRALLSIVCKSTETADIIASRLEELERENTALREDKERLDWLGNLITIDGWDPRKKRLVELTHPIRVSIDAARKEAQP